MQFKMGNHTSVGSPIWFSCMTGSSMERLASAVAYCIALLQQGAESDKAKTKDSKPDYWLHCLCATSAVMMEEQCYAGGIALPIQQMDEIEKGMQQESVLGWLDAN